MEGSVGGAEGGAHDAHAWRAEGRARKGRGGRESPSRGLGALTRLAPPDGLAPEREREAVQRQRPAPWGPIGQRPGAELSRALTLSAS